MMKIGVKMVKKEKTKNMIGGDDSMNDIYGYGFLLAMLCFGIVMGFIIGKEYEALMQEEEKEREVINRMPHKSNKLK